MVVDKKLLNIIENRFPKDKFGKIIIDATECSKGIINFDIFQKGSHIGTLKVKGAKSTIKYNENMEPYLHVKFTDNIIVL